MAKTSGIGDNLYVNGYDLSGDVGSVDQVSGGPALLDVTSIKQGAHERITGLRDGNLQFTSFWSSNITVSTPSFPLTTVPVISTYAFSVLVTIAAGTVTNVSINGSTAGTGDGTYVLPALGTITVTYTGSPTWAWAGVGHEHSALSPLPKTDVIASYYRGTTLLSPGFSINGKQINYDPTRDNSGNLTLKTEVQANGFGGEWGKQITAGPRTDTTATTGAAVDENPSAGTAFGAQAYVQLVDFVGTSVTITVSHATTSGGSYTSLFATTALTTVGAVRLSVSNATTVNEFLKVATTGTFTLATFAVTFMRNQSAVVF